MITLYGHDLSGNSYKARLLLELLNLDYEWVQVDLLKGAHKSPEYLALNPFGQVPTLVDGDVTLADAQAILVYLARQYGGDRWLPTDALALAKVIRWLSTAAGEVRQGPENARLHHLFSTQAINLDRAHEKATFILTQLDKHLLKHEWLVLERLTIADIAVFPYVALARDGKIDLTLYPNVLGWIERIKQLPNFFPMTGI
ncbi:MAG: glutathione S-transferase [Cyanobacteria bacterium P01_F01_bin.56]